MIAVRAWSFPASAMPVIVSTAYVYWKYRTGTAEDFVLWPAIAALALMVLLHAAGNTWSDWFDFRKGVDAKDTFGATSLTSGMFTPREIMVISIVIISAGIIGGTALIIATGLPLLWIGLGGLACNSRKPDNGGHPARQQYPRHRHGHPLADPHHTHRLRAEDSQSHLLQGFFQRQERLSETTGYVPAVHTVLSVVQGRDIPCSAVQPHSQTGRIEGFITGSQETGQKARQHIPAATGRHSGIAGGIAGDLPVRSDDSRMRSLDHHATAGPTGQAESFLHHIC